MAGRAPYTTFWAAMPFPLLGIVAMLRLDGKCSGHNFMKLIAVYVVLVLIGELIAYFIGRTVEHWSNTASLPVFLACFFFVFWGAWRLAIRLT